jgi:tetratricopeptide (TPR) repeat protein
VKRAVKLIITIFIGAIFVLFLPAVKTQAITQDSAPYKTYTQGPSGLILTQTAYEPTGNLSLQVQLANPEDFFIKEGFIYIADTGNKRIVKVDFHGNIDLEISNLENPTGIYVDEFNNIFVADPELKAVIKYNQLGAEITRFLRPTEPLFGTKTPYQPLKVVSGPRDVLYIVGVGSVDGLIQLNQYGEFLGFFGPNETTKTFFGLIADFFNVRYARRTPVSADNLAIDNQGSVYTVSKTQSRRIKKFNISSKVSFSIEHDLNLKDVKVNSFGNIYTISDQGIINEYDNNGNLIFQFGALDQGTEILGKFINPVALELDANNNIYVLDKGNSTIQILAKSPFADKIHQGLINYADGIYNIDEWREVLKMNSFFSLANKSIANALYRDNKYDEALYYFKIAQDRNGYSEAFWQVRYDWMQANLALIFIIFIAVFAILKSLKYVDRKYQIYRPIRSFAGYVGKQKLVRESKYIFMVIRHPLDTTYAIKKENKSSYLTATLIYILFAALSLASAYLTGFIFNYNDLTNYSVLINVLIQVGLILLFVVANHLISSLQSGEGWFKDIYIGIAYALAPVILMIVPLVVLSHLLTYNEIFIYDVLNLVAWSYTFILMIIMTKEIHNYSFKQLIVNLLLTIFAMLMIILVMFLIYLLSLQLYDYVESLIREVVLRV